MNKKALFLSVAMGVAILAVFSIQRVKSLHAEAQASSANVKPPARPSAPVSYPPTNIVVRAIDTRQPEEEWDTADLSVSKKNFGVCSLSLWRSGYGRVVPMKGAASVRQSRRT